MGFFRQVVLLSGLCQEEQIGPARLEISFVLITSQQELSFLLLCLPLHHLSTHPTPTNILSWGLQVQQVTIRNRLETPHSAA